MKDNQKQPGISFDGIILAKENFWRDYNVPENGEPELAIKVDSVSQQQNGVLELSYDLKLKDQEKTVLKLEGTFVGFFSTAAEENMPLEQFIQNHAPAFMFPYVREHIATITQKAGVQPVLLPPINILAMLKENEKNDDKAE